MKLVNGIKTSEITTNFYVPLRDLLDAFVEGAIIPYEWNRGAGGVSKSRVDDIAEDFALENFGIVYIEEMDDPKQFQQWTAHHRCNGALKAYKEGNLTQSQLNTMVVVSLIKKGHGQDVYIREGSAKGHTTRNKLTNPDSGLGDVLINDILSKVKLPADSSLNTRDIIRPQYDNAIVYCLLNVQSHPRSEWSKLNYLDVSKNKKTGIESLANLTPEGLKEENNISQYTKKTVSDSLQYVVDVYHEFVKINTENGKKARINSLPDYAKDLLGQASFFGFLLWSKIGEQKFTKNKPVKLARKMKSHNQGILTNAKRLRLNEDTAIAKILEHMQ